MPSSFPFRPKAPANAAGDEAPDWAVSDFPTFERAVNTGASAYRPAAQQGGEIIKTAGRKVMSPLDHAKQYAIDHLGVPPDKANKVVRYGLGYAFRDGEGAKVLWGMSKNKPGTITRAQEAELQDVLRDPRNRNADLMREKYNELIASGKLRIVP